jgi:hypothetical protein
VVIFAREISDSLTSLVKEIDQLTSKHKSEKMGSFVVFCNDDEELSDRLKKLADKSDIQQCILTIDKPDGPPGYKIAKEADVTVIFYRKRKVLLNRAFETGKLDDKNIQEIVQSIDKAFQKESDNEKKDKP